MPANWPFPRWYGYLNIWLVGLFELGGPAFNFKTGPFSWRGLFAYWSPFALFGLWILLTTWLLLRALKGQLADERSAMATPDEPVALVV
jgi:hypothetical protein